MNVLVGRGLVHHRNTNLKEQLERLFPPRIGQQQILVMDVSALLPLNGSPVVRKSLGSPS